MGRVIRNPAILAVSLGHTSVDLLNSALPVLLVVFAARLGLSNAELGTVATIYLLAASVTQPGFGLLADRWSSRWLGIGALLWQASCFALAAYLPGYAAFAAFAAGGLGSAAYHPQGAMHARRSAGVDAATGTSVFFFFGFSGQGIGPLLAGLLLGYLQPSGAILVMVALAIPAVLLLARFGPRAGDGAGLRSGSEAAPGLSMAWGALPLVAFVLVLSFLSYPQAATTTFLPKWLADAGFSSRALGSLMSTYLIASAFGNIFGGSLADRWSRKGVVILAMVVAALPFYALYHTPSTGVLAILAAALAGFATGMPQSVLILMGQNLFPGRMGLASGLVMGVFFGLNALAAWITGLLADRIGLSQALLVVPATCVLAAICATVLPRTRRRITGAPAFASGE